MKSNRAVRRATPLLETISSLLASTFLYPPSFLGLDFLSAPFFFPFLSLYLSLPFSSLFSSLRPLHARFRLSLFFYSSSSSSFLSSREEGNTEREREREAHKPFFTRGEAQREQQQPTVSFLSRNLWANRSLPFPLAVLNAIFKNAEVE